MSTASELATQLGVDESVVQSILNLAGKQAVKGPDEIAGFVSCINQACQDVTNPDTGERVTEGMFGIDRPVRLRVERCEQTYKDLGGNLAFTDRSTEHYSLEDDSDLTCPACGDPCALIPGKRRVIPKSQFTVA